MNRRNLFVGLGIFAIVVIAGIALYTWWNVNKPLAQIDGTARLEGLKATAQVTRDTSGVPHIVADDLDDLYAAQGYVHAQDRLYQMFFFRTLGRGRLAELFQPSLVDADRFLRSLGFARVAEAEYGQLDAGARSSLEAFARGVNAFVNGHRDSLPVEFGLLGVSFEEWTPIDSLLFGKVQALDLTDTWANELLASDLVQALGQETARALLPGYPPDAQGSTTPSRTRAYERDIEAFVSVLRPLKSGWGEGMGSNTWAVAGSNSATGKPLLANDPHLGVRSPSIWYEVHLSTRDGSHDVAGFGFAGVPGIVTGHNRDIAWGVTNLAADVMDVYLERLDPVGHPGQYMSGGQWKPLTILTETLQVREGTPVTQTVRLTEHGPIISDAVPISPAISTTISGTYSIRWTALEPSNIFEALNELQTAANWQEFRSALSKWDVPGQNFVYADNQGNIGYQATGRLPLRGGRSGSVPVEGWTGENEWIGYIPFDDLPSAYNPQEGFVASANNRPYDEGAPNAFPGYFAQPWRIERIREVLSARDKLALDDLQALQLNTRSGLARRVLPFITALQPADEPGKLALERLKNWDGTMAADSVPAAIYEVTYNTVLSRTLGDEMERELFLQYTDNRPGEALRAVSDLLDRPDDPLWDRKDTEGVVEKRDDVLEDAITRATAELSAYLGEDMNGWTWGKIHQITPRHEFSGAAMVGGMFQMPAQPLGGSMSTVAVAGYPLVAAAYPLQQPYPVTLHQSYRMLLDTAEWSRSRAIYATGQSGQPGSAFRDNMYQLWVRGDYLPMLFDPGEIAQAKKGVLTLTP
jgi:penicillin amidase